MTMFTALCLCLVSACLGDIVLKERSYLKLPSRSGSLSINSGVGKESAYDESGRLLYIVGSQASILQIVDVNDADNPTITYTEIFDFTTTGYPLDIQFCRTSSTEAIFAISFGETDPTRAGHVIFYDAFKKGETSLNPKFEKSTVGANPDNIKFTFDCVKLVVTNEGIPAVIDENFIDPPGTVSILTIPTSGNPSVSEVTFTQYDTPAETDRLIGLGIRYIVRVNPTSGQQNPLSNNLEPEYIAISPNNAYAYITLQENNAIVRVDLEQNSVTDIFPMGYKDFEFSTLDLSDKDGSPGVKMAKRKVRGLYQPDKITFMEWGGKLYLVTADEGKPFSSPSAGVSDNKRAFDLTDDEINLDPELVLEIKDNTQLGRAFVSTVDRKSLTEKITALHVFGGRGFSVFNASTLERVWESGDEIEKFSRWFYPDVFNSGYTGPNLTPSQDRNKRSPLMGPELNSVAVGSFKGRHLMIFGSGTNGQVYVFQLQASVPTRVEPEFQSVYRRGATDATWNTLYSRGEMGDIGISDIKFVDEALSPVPGSPLVIVLSETSGSVSFYSLEDEQFPNYMCIQPNLLHARHSMNHHNRSSPLF